MLGIAQPKKKKVKCTIVGLWYNGTAGTSGLLTPGQFSLAKLLHFSSIVSRDRQNGREENNIGGKEEEGM